MDLQKILTSLSGIVDGAAAVAGPLAAIGVPYAGLVKAGLDVAKNIEARLAEGTVVATSADHAQVAQIIAALEAENDRLAAEIDAS